MKLLGIVEEIQRAFGGGKAPADSKFNDRDYLFQKILKNSFLKHNRIRYTYHVFTSPNYHLKRFQYV